MNKLKQTREKKGITQSELAELAGLSVSMISKLEQGLRNPTIANAQKIASVLSATVYKIWEF